MTVSVQMFAPAASGTFVAQDGTIYTSDANAIISSVAPGDIDSLTNQGCTVLSKIPVVTPVNSSYIVPGAFNIIPSTAASTVSYAYTLAAAAAVGVVTYIAQTTVSTAVSTVTSSLATISTGTVLSFNAMGVIGIISRSSSKYDVLARSPLSSLAAVASS